MTRVEALEQGRDAVRRGAWADAFARLSTADRAGDLPPHDLENLARAAHLLGKEAECAEVLARAHRGFVEAGDAERAARCAIWLALELSYRGERAQASGWQARARRLLDDGKRDCVELGYLLLPEAMRAVSGGEFEKAHRIFVEATAIGARFGDVDLVTYSRHGQGRALLRMGEIVRAMMLLDEAMVAVTAGELSPNFAGIIYCSVIEGCHEVFDLRRAQEWTQALDAWCASLPDALPYRAHCLVRRAEILQFHGAWDEAYAEARRAAERLTRPAPRHDAGGAFYRMAELNRLRGAYTEAESGYKQASACGKDPQPGFALMRLAQGQVSSAFAAMRREREPTGSSGAIALASLVEIALAAEDVAAARSAADTLSALSSRVDAPFLRALSAYAAGAILLVEGNPHSALPVLRRAADDWRELDAPYEVARARVLIGRACLELGDADTAALEWEAAGRIFRELGAFPDLERLLALSKGDTTPNEGGLTDREVEVIALVATGRTNRAIAAKLGISEKTVARHVSNIFAKLGLSSRAAATAYAYEHGIVEPPT
jgi:DNA-binding CsgD family transcriptional regulator